MSKVMAAVLPALYLEPGTEERLQIISDLHRLEELPRQPDPVVFAPFKPVRLVDTPPYVPGILFHYQMLAPLGEALRIELPERPPVEAEISFISEDAVDSMAKLVSQQTSEGFLVGPPALDYHLQSQKDAP